VTAEALVRVSSDGLDLRAAFQFARTLGGTALAASKYAARAAQLSEVAKSLQARRDDYYDDAISLANSGTTKNDSAVDIDGGILTASYYAKLGATLGEVQALRDGAPVSLSKDQKLQVHACADAHAWRRALYQRVQLSVVGIVGEGRACPALGRARHRQARDCGCMTHACRRCLHLARRRAIGDMR
jgi:hypothetical protein